MMHRLRRYDVFRFAQNDVAPVGRNDAMFAIMCRQAHIIRRSRHHRATPCIICRRQTSFKKRTFVGRQKCVFFWCGKRDLNPYGVNHTPLKRARLPVPPLPHIASRTLVRNAYIIHQTFQKVNTFLKNNLE